MAIEARKASSLRCRHDGFHSATSRYDSSTGVLRFVLVCEGCSAEVREVTRLAYRPSFTAQRDAALAA